jgi:hypothetical protein
MQSACPALGTAAEKVLNEGLGRKEPPPPPHPPTHPPQRHAGMSCVLSSWESGRETEFALNAPTNPAPLPSSPQDWTLQPAIIEAVLPGSAVNLGASLRRLGPRRWAAAVQPKAVRSKAVAGIPACRRSRLTLPLGGLAGRQERAARRRLQDADPARALPCSCSQSVAGSASDPLRAAAR